jgi:hypothetical protein
MTPRSDDKLELLQGTLDMLILKTLAWSVERCSRDC